MQMREGKISETVCKRSVIRQMQTKPKNQIEDQIYTIHPECRYTAHAAAHGVYHVINHLAAEGAKPTGVLAELLLPPSMQEEALKEMMRQIDSACQEADVALIGGHTQVTKAVEQPLLTFTGIGKKDSSMLRPQNCAGLDVVVTKSIGLEGTVLLATEKEKELVGRYPQAMIDTAKAFEAQIPAWREAALAGKSAACVMQDVSEGGIFAALWELASATGVGLDIDLKKIPIRQETVEICEYFGLNPYELCGQGSLLIFTEDSTALCRACEQAQIAATLIGKTTDGKDRVLWNEDEKRFLEPPKMDQIEKLSFE